MEVTLTKHFLEMTKNDWVIKFCIYDNLMLYNTLTAE